ncbi:MAG: hypothetical protein Kow006_09550 [Gammaproteobacteria bacterium]
MSQSSAKRAQWCRIVGLVWLFAVGGLEGAHGSHEGLGLETTYERLLPLAVGGDARVQNLLGYMFFQGEGVSRDFQMAHYWFHRAASLGNVPAQRNLVVFHSGESREVPSEYRDEEEVRYWLSRLNRPRAEKQVAPGNNRGDDDSGGYGAAGYSSQGEYVYQSFCGGCHGFNGISYYVHSPSFALGERMDKSDSELRRSIAEGVGAMPAWGSILSTGQLDAVVGYIRTLARYVEEGIGQNKHDEPGLYLRFVPLGESPTYWKEYESYFQTLDE